MPSRVGFAIAHTPELADIADRGLVVNGDGSLMKILTNRFKRKQIFRFHLARRSTDFCCDGDGQDASRFRLLERVWISRWTSSLTKSSAKGSEPQTASPIVKAPPLCPPTVVP